MSDPAAPAPFSREPLRTDRGIPVFCESDSYVDNYAKIASDHVESMRPGADNPFIPDELWKTLDQSTRALIEKHVQAGQSILDVGVGLGRVLAPLQHLTRHGVDISLDYLEHAKRAGINVAFARVESLPYPAAAFDAVVTCDVLEHVFDLHQACREILRVLKPGGLLFVRVPNKEDLEVYLRADLPYEFIHLRSFDLNGLRLLMQKVFKVEFVEGGEVGHHLQGVPRLRLRLLPEPTRTMAAKLARQHWLKCFGVHRAFSVSEQVIEHWLVRLKQRAPELFDKLAPLLILGIEFNAVFRKPSRAGSGLP